MQLQQRFIVLAGLRIVLCMMPQNEWLSAEAPLFMGNLPKYSVCTDGITYHRFVLQKCKRKQ